MRCAGNSHASPLYRRMVCAFSPWRTTSAMSCQPWAMAERRGLLARPKCGKLPARPQQERRPIPSRLPTQKDVPMALRPGLFLACVATILVLAPNGLAQAPDGLSGSDWTSIQEAYQSGRHAMIPSSGGGYRAPNPGQHWTTSFDGRGFTVEPGT